MQWEEILPHWLAWITSLPLLADIGIPRWVVTPNSHDTHTYFL